MILKSSIIENDIVTITKANYGDNAFMPDHFHDKTAISFVLSGSIIETVNNNDTLGGIANVIIKPKKTVHRDVYSKNCSIICIYLNAENELSNSTQNLLKNWSWLHSPDNYMFLNTILKSKKEKEQLEGIENFIAYFNRKKKDLNYQLPPIWLKELKNILDTSYNESLNSSELANMFKVHPVYMARVFRKFYGQSIKSYLNILRVNGTMASILNSNDKLASIAYDNGYSDQSHLNRKFKTATGMTPHNFKCFTN
jgi:AraC-like DNA-binding protein